MRYLGGFLINKSKHCISAQIVNTRNVHDVVINEKLLGLSNVPVIDLSKYIPRNENDVSLNTYQNNIKKFTCHDESGTKISGTKISGSLVNNNFFNANILPFDSLVKVKDNESKQIKTFKLENIEYLVSESQWNEINYNYDNEIKYCEEIINEAMKCDIVNNNVRLVKEFFNAVNDPCYSSLIRNNSLNNCFVICAIKDDKLVGISDEASYDDLKEYFT